MDKHLTAVLSILILVLCDVSLATAKKKTEDQKNTYIVQVSKSKMPANFRHPSIWYKSILQSISDSAEMLYIYDNAIHGFATILTAEEVLLLKSQYGILNVLPDEKYELLTTRTPHFLGLDKIPDMFVESSNGSDMIIGVIDTGIWPESKSFKDTGYGPIPRNWKGKCEKGSYFTIHNCNKKLIGARFYKTGHVAMAGLFNESQESISPRDDFGHGTHVASIVAGSAVKKASLFGFASGTAHGMAPAARVAVYKVCWADNVWGIACMASDILYAIDQAISDNVNILSVSIGRIPEVAYYNDSIAIGAFAAIEHGILVSFSAGNWGPNPFTLSMVPPWVITVGASTIDRNFPAYVSLGNGQNYSGVSLYSGKALPHRVSFIYAGNASKGFGAALCLPNSLVPKKVKGKIVLCESGRIYNAEKGDSVKSAGGLGMVLVNVAAKKDELMADAHVLPATFVGFKAGEAIKNYLFSDPKPMVTIVFKKTQVGIRQSPVVAAFSSRGPNYVTPMVLKPDLIAPGVNILAAYTRNAGPTGMKSDHRRVNFNIMSGTSMACPHVSGIAALIKSAHPNWSPAAIRSALMTTAYTTYKNGKPLLDSATKEAATPFDLGAGHVNPVPAFNPGLVYNLTVVDYLNFLCALNYTADQIEAVARRKYNCDQDKHYSVTDLNYPSFAVVFEPVAGGYGAAEVKHTRTLTNVGDAGTYKVMVKSDIPSIKISVEPRVLSFNKNEKRSYTVTFRSSGPKPHYPHGFGRIEWSDGKRLVGSPISFSWV